MLWDSLAALRRLYIGVQTSEFELGGSGGDGGEYPQLQNEMVVDIPSAIYVEVSGPV